MNETLQEARERYVREAASHGVTLPLVEGPPSDPHSWDGEPGGNPNHGYNAKRARPQPVQPQPTNEPRNDSIPVPGEDEDHSWDGEPGGNPNHGYNAKRARPQPVQPRGPGEEEEPLKEMGRYDPPNPYLVDPSQRDGESDMPTTQKAYEEGRKAARQGMELTDCPYEADAMTTGHRDAWVMGHREASHHTMQESDSPLPPPAPAPVAPGSTTPMQEASKKFMDGLKEACDKDKDGGAGDGADTGKPPATTKSMGMLAMKKFSEGLAAPAGAAPTTMSGAKQSFAEGLQKMCSEANAKLAKGEASTYSDANKRAGNELVAANMLPVAKVAPPLPVAKIAPPVKK